MLVCDLCCYTIFVLDLFSIRMTNRYCFTLHLTDIHLEAYTKKVSRVLFHPTYIHSEQEKINEKNVKLPV